MPDLAGSTACALREYDDAMPACQRLEHGVDGLFLGCAGDDPYWLKEVVDETKDDAAVAEFVACRDGMGCAYACCRQEAEQQGYVQVAVVIRGEDELFEPGKVLATLDAHPEQEPEYRSQEQQVNPDGR